MNIEDSFGCLGRHAQQRKEAPDLVSQTASFLEANTSTKMTTESPNHPPELDKDQASSATIVKDGYTIPSVDVTDEAASCSSSTIVSACDDDDMQSNDGEYEVAHGKKRRKRCLDSASPFKDEANLQVGHTVLFIPTGNHQARSLSKIKLTDFLNNAAPSMVSEIRINKARNIIAVDTKRPLFKAELLKLTKLCALPVTAFLPRDRSNSFGVLRDIDPDCTEDDVKTHLQSSVGIAEVKRLGKKSPVIRVAFTGRVPPQHVKKTQLLKMGFLSCISTSRKQKYYSDSSNCKWS
ncbi:hypothetical protein HPB47_011458 [Ixodes persulcatus]|uniref:Uncharacterized protein n=1 Tax=Ixodes persulcatus TaxID=34615 RepID=A0AC60NWJ3_IXOPE|nr:hypothetical protein HPB47_011458 [Ixodes persulcatus]